jgi:hypothetical protein
MSSSVSPEEFCRAMMHDYERQWTLAQGHAQRHPLRIKMDQLEALMQHKMGQEDFERILIEGASGDDWELGLLCADLEPRWRAARDGKPDIGT